MPDHDPRMSPLRRVVRDKRKRAEVDARMVRLENLLTRVLVAEGQCPTKLLMEIRAALQIGEAGARS